MTAELNKEFITNLYRINRLHIKFVQYVTLLHYKNKQNIRITIVNLRSDRL